MVTAPGARLVNVLGVCVHAQTMDSAVAQLAAWVAEGGHRYVCVADANAVMSAQRDPSFKPVMNGAAMVTTDGMPLVWSCRLRGHPAERVYGPDLMPAVLAASEDAGWRHVFYGTTEQTLEALQRRMQERFPKLIIADAIAPPFRPQTPEEDAAITARINAARPDVVWVGLGAPKQERWMADHLGRIEAPLMLGVGAAFDFLAGRKRQAPPWMRRNGLEWLFRLASEPRRLGPRYVRTVPGFIALSLLQAAFPRRFPLIGHRSRDG